MNAKDIQEAIVRDRWREGLVLPNYYAADWWECDVFELTKAGFFREYEVKVSRADFFADAKKTREIWPSGWGPNKVKAVENKHQLLASRSTRGPSQFWFCTPPGMLTLEEIPEWAGLIEVRNCESEFSSIKFWPREVKKAPKLHREKFGDRAAHARGICYWRMHDALKTCEPALFTDEPEAVEHGAGI
jgi:hypothetical protein